MQFLSVSGLHGGRGGGRRRGLRKKVKRKNQKEGERWESALHVDMDNKQCSVRGNQAKSVDTEAVEQE